jgi:hypothetical protein
VRTLLLHRSRIPPHFPMFLLGRSRRPLVSLCGDGRAAFGYSTRRLATAAGLLLLKRGIRGVGVLSVSTPERLGQVVSQLARHHVQYMIWDDLADSPTRTFIDLSEYGERETPVDWPGSGQRPDQ